MAAIFIFEWSLLRLGVTLAITITLTSTLMIITERYLLGEVLNIYYLYVLAFVSVMLSNSLLAIAANVKPDNIIWQTFLIALLLALSYFPYFASTAYCRSLIFFITPAHSASIVESYRLVIQQLSSALAFFLSSYVYDSLMSAILTYAVIAFFITLNLLSWFEKRYLVRLSKGRSGEEEIHN